MFNNAGIQRALKKVDTTRWQTLPFIIHEQARTHAHKWARSKIGMVVYQKDLWGSSNEVFITL